MKSDSRRSFPSQGDGASRRGSRSDTAEFARRGGINFNIPVELTWQANHCQLKEKIKAIKLTINPMVGQPSETKDGAAEIYPVYGVPDLSRFYDEP